MIFDRFCALVERVELLQPLRPIMAKARIFEFPGVAHEVLRETYDFSAEDTRFMWDHFFLPFPAIAIEDPLSCVLLWSPNPEQQGLTERWYFAECMPVFSDPAGAFDGEPLKEQFGHLRGEATPHRIKYEMMVSVGWVRGVDLTNPETFGATFEGDLGLNLFADAKTGRLLFEPNAFLLNEEDRKCALRSSTINGRAALEEVMHFNTPHRFVVEREAAFGVKTNPRKLKRSDARPKYQLKTVTEIRRDLPLQAPSEGGGTKVSRAVTERRAHWRHYPDDSERWPQAHGKTIRIPASWVGPTECRVGKHIYRVRLDL